MAAVAKRRKRLAVVIPTLNEAQGITGLLESLQPLRTRGHRLLVVDGGSCDDTPDLARPLADAVLQAPQGRAMQMHAGALASDAEVLWFLHADSRVPQDADRLIESALMRPGVRWGYFNIRLEDAGGLLRLVARMMNLRTRLTGIVTGDQGLFVYRDSYLRAGGFPPVPLMEDIALSKRLRRVARPGAARAVLQTSARRWQRHGILRTILLMWILRLGYWLGLQPRYLARMYRAHGT